MSANNQTLIVQSDEDNKFYVFANVMAESWCMLGDDDKETGEYNILSIRSASGSFNTRDQAYSFALALEDKDDLGGTEYGVQFNRLAKDGASVILIS